MTSKVLEQVKSAFNFTVDKFPLSGPDNMKTEWYGLFRSDTSKPVGNGSVTDRYHPHQTDDVVALVEAAMEAFDGEVETRTHFRDGHYVAIAPTKDYRKSIFGTSDNIWPRLLIDASYSGKAFLASMGYYRDVCKNMHIMRSVSSTSRTIRHTSGLRDKMDDLIKTFRGLKNSWNTLTGTIQQMETNQVSMVDFLNAVYGEPDPESKRAITIHRNRTEEIFRRLQRDLRGVGKGDVPKNFTVSAWDAFNAIQGFEQHDSTRRKDFAGDFDRILLAVNDPAVKLAERYAIEGLPALAAA